jgi:hypothetical protein
MKHAIVVALTVAGLLVGAGAAAEAQCLRAFKDLRSVDKKESVRFMESLIDSLLLAKQAGTRVRPEDVAFGPLLVGLKHRREDYRCASLTIEPFAKSQDEIARKVAGVFIDNYSALVANTDQTISTITNGLNTPKDTRVGDQMEKIAGLRQQRDELENLLVMGAAQSTYVLIEFGPDGKTTGRLKVTSVERQGLLRLLQKSFGASVSNPKADKQGTVDAFEGAGNLIYTVLANPKWRNSDAVKP